MKQPPRPGYVRGLQPPPPSLAELADLDDLELAADVFLGLGEAKLAIYAGLRWLVYGLWNSSRIVVAIHRVPKLKLDGVPRDDEIRRYFRQRRWGVPARLGVGVLVLPDDPGDYLRGRWRQAVRNNCNRARELGWRYVAPLDPAELLVRIDKLLKARSAPPTYRKWLTRRIYDGEGEFRFVDDEHRQPVALGVFTVAGSVAMLHWMISDEREGRSAARYLLSAGLAAELASRRVKYLLSESVLFLPPGIRYFQKRLGYETYTLVFSGRS